MRWHVIVAILLLLTPAAVSYFHHALFGIEKSIRVESVDSAPRYVEISPTELNRFRYVKMAMESNETIKVPGGDETTDEFIELLIRGNTSVFKVGDRLYRLIVIFD